MAHRVRRSDLPVEVGHVDGVHVDDVNVGEAAQRQVLEDLAAEAAGADHQHASLKQSQSVITGAQTGDRSVGRPVRRSAVPLQSSSSPPSLTEFCTTSSGSSSSGAKSAVHQGPRRDSSGRSDDHSSAAAGAAPSAAEAVAAAAAAGEAALGVSSEAADADAEEVCDIGWTGGHREGADGWV